MRTTFLLLFIFINCTLFAQNGKIQSKKEIKLSEISFLWNKLTENNVLKDEYKHVSNLNFYRITYRSDSLLVNGIIVEPKRDGKFPVIIFNRGGNKEVGKKAILKTLYPLLITASSLANEGYVILASCYRENDEFGGKDINDVLALIQTAKEVKKANTTKIGMFGWSRGGMMTYLALQKNDEIKTAVVGNGPTELQDLIVERPMMETMVYAKLIPNYNTNKEKELKKRSVVYWTDELSKKSSLLILCGSQDKRVNPNQAEKLSKKLEEINYDYKLMKFDTNHSFSGKRKVLSETLISWFNKKL